MLKKALSVILIYCIFFQPLVSVLAQIPMDGGMMQPPPEAPQLNIPRGGGGGSELTVGGFDIHLLGEISSPGTYRIRPNERLLKAITMAGSTTHFAALNRVELRRARQKTRIVNLIDLFRKGELENNPYLQENDIVFVPRAEAAAQIQGTVKYPGVYEIDPRGSTSAWDLIKKADGFTVGLATGKPITIIRYDNSNDRKVIEVNNVQSELENFKLIDGDTVHLPHKFTVKNKFDDSVKSLPNDQIAYPTSSNLVYVLGGVKLPGKIPFDPQLSISKYVAMVGGLARLGREDIIIYRSGGEVIKTNLRSQEPVNPGDSIVVGEDKLGPDFWANYMISIAGLSLSVLSTVILLKR